MAKESDIPEDILKACNNDVFHVLEEVQIAHDGVIIAEFDFVVLIGDNKWLGEEAAIVGGSSQKRCYKCYHMASFFIIDCYGSSEREWLQRLQDAKKSIAGMLDIRGEIKASGSTCKQVFQQVDSCFRNSKAIYTSK